MFRMPLVLAAAILLAVDPAATFSQQENVPLDTLPNSQAGKRIRKVREFVDAAGELLKQQRYTESGRKIVEGQVLLLRAAEYDDGELREWIEPEYSRIKRAHELLTNQGVTLPKLNRLPRLRVPQIREPEEGETTPPTTDSAKEAK